MSKTITRNRLPAMMSGLLTLLTLAAPVWSQNAEQATGLGPNQEQRIAPGEYVRYSIALPDALPGEQGVHIHLGRQDGAFRQAWAQVDGTGHLAEHVDAAGLAVRGGRLRGEVELWVATERGEPMYRAVYELDVPIDAAQGRGQFTGRYSIRTGSRVYDTDELIVQPDQVRLFAYGDELGGELEGEVQARAADSKPARFDLVSGHLLEGDLSYTRYVILRFDIEDDNVSNLEFVPRSPNGATWTAEVVEVELAFEDGRLEGQIAVDITGGGPRTRDGRYSFNIEARVSDNEVAGGFSDGCLNGEKIGGSGLSGSARGLYEPDDDRLYVLSLPEAIEAREGRDGLLRANLGHADGRLQGGVAMCPRFTQRFEVDPDQLSVDGNRLKGVLPVHFTPDSPVIARPEPFTVDYDIDARIDGEGGIAGRYKATFGPVQEVQGPAAVRVRQAEALQQAEALRDGFDWPNWNGPNGNFTATPSGDELVDRLAEARLVWASEHTPPARCQTTRYGEGNISRYLTRGGAAGGGSSPVVAEGIVYQYYFQPTGEAMADYPKQQADAGNRTLGAEMWALKAEDVVLAMDASTGQTVWKTVVPGGRYHSWQGTGRAKGAYTANPAVGGGRVYVHATGNRTMCLNARTGEMLWMNNRGGQQVVALEEMAVFSGSHVTALDGETGEIRWRVEDAGSEAAAPLHWRHDGTSYIISGNRNGRVVCIEADTGDIRWELENVGANHRTMAMGQRHLLLNAGGLDDEPDRLGAYHITPDGAEHLWT
ncbi:MAG: PQQ-binding-like beta-propeller repeat protein, partial [Planctomycetota bacterium]